MKGIFIRTLRGAIGMVTLCLFLFGFSVVKIHAEPGGKKFDHSMLSPRNEIEVSGKITDENGEGLPGATISVEGTTTGTSTDVDGNFRISVDEEATLIVSYIGYTTQRIQVNGRSVINIQLEMDISQLDEIVVIGYGTIKKESLTASVAQIDNEGIQTTTHVSLAQKLSGKIPGLQIRQNSGQPGQFDNSINIRGFGSPIYIIDGIKREGGGEFQRLNPNDIESISILKDASAAIYGLGAANGVVLITTKKGSKDRTRFSYTNIVGAIVPTGIPRMANAAEYVEMYNDAQIFQRGGGNPYYSQEEVENWRLGGPGYESTDWYAETMKKRAIQLQQNLSMSGGSETTSYFISLGYMNENGLLKSGDMGYKRYNLRSNITTQLSENLEAQILVGGRWDEAKEPGDNFFNIFKGTRVALPIESPYANEEVDPTFLAPHFGGYYPVAQSQADLTGYAKGDNRNLQSSISLEYTLPFLEDLSVKGVASYDANTYNFKALRKSYDLFTWSETESKFIPQTINQGGGSVRNRSVDRSGITFQGYINYSKQINNHDMSAVLVYEQNQGKSRDFEVQRFYRTFYTKDYLRFADPGEPQSDGIESEYADVSYISRLNYSFKDKYLVEIAGRYMGSYRYAPSSRWGLFPMGSVGWVVSREDFLKNTIPLISELKLRASYGVIGQPEGDAFQYVQGYTVGSGGNWEFEEGQLTTGITSPVPANANLTWMKAKTFDVGLDLGLWTNKLTFTTDYYERLLDGIPARPSVALPNYYGGELPQENLNSQLTRGIEFMLGYTDEFADVQYSVSGNFSYARTKRIYVEGETYNNSWQEYRNRRAGRWNDIVWGYVYDGQFQSEDELRDTPMQNGSTGNIVLEKPGDFRYKDLNNDGMINGEDMVPIFLNNTPKMYYGLNMNASWKGFDVNVLWQGAAGFTIRYDGPYTEIFAFRGNTPAYFHDRWHKEDPYNPDSEWVPGTWPVSRLIADVGRMYVDSEIWRRDASYVRLKSVELGYTLTDENILGPIGFEQVRIYANGFNLVTFTDEFLKPFDPEKKAGSHSSGFEYPLARTFNLGININF